MTLTTHAVAGGLVGALVAENPAIAGLMGFASHFLLDAIPHWDYSLHASHEDELEPLNNDIDVKDPKFFIDLAKIAFDAILGTAIVIAIFYAAGPRVLAAAVIGALFAILPDPLQFMYMKTR